MTKEEILAKHLNEKTHKDGITISTCTSYILDAMEEYAASQQTELPKLETDFFEPQNDKQYWINLYKEISQITFKGGKARHIIEHFYKSQPQRRIELDELAKDKGIVCWIVPCSDSLPPHKVTWGYEIEVLPFCKIGEYCCLSENKSNIFYSYEEWETYDEAKIKAIEKANKIHEEWLRSEVEKRINQKQ